MKKLIDIVIERKIKTIAIIGLAKNSGKTVTFNTLIKEAKERNFSLVLLSYGRDGEETDILNRHKKPLIYIPPETIFVTTTQALLKSNLKASKISSTGFTTTLGEVNIYQSIEGGNVELVGINSSKGLKKVKELISKKVDLVLIDGALDRRSSAIPELTGGMILATGAVIGNSEELVVKRTINEINKLNLPEINDINLRNIINKSETEKRGIISGYDLTSFVSETSFDIINELKIMGNIAGKIVVLNGALTDSFIEEFCYSLDPKNCRIIVKNATKIFLNQRSINLLKKYETKLYVLNKLQLLAVTINPVSPYDVNLNSETLIKLLKERLENIPVYDLMSEEYLSEKEVIFLQKKLNIDHSLVDRCRQSAKSIADGIQIHINENTTISVERTILRLIGIDGIDGQEIPMPNVLVDQVYTAKQLNKGILYWLGNAIVETGKSPQEIADAVGEGELSLLELPQNDWSKIKEVVDNLSFEAVKRIKNVREKRKQLQQKYPPGIKPWLYVIVASGNIYEDVIQARAAARQGADIIAVIRSTAQSLLDYVPYGATKEGFGGTYATQENFRIMRKALDEIGEELGRYIMLVNYCSGLCMPEIAVMGAIERLDMMLNDAMYGILFRDINMKRTFIDQYFSRMINACAGIIINTGEDNYLTTADAVEEAHTVLASQFINEELATRSGLKPEQMGLGHAFEINPDLENGFLFELAHAQLIRQVFPDASLKYMPPTKHMTGDIFKGHLMDGMFNLAAIITGQDIQLLGMLTEAVHTPFLHDRALSIANAKYIFNNARNLQDELIFAPEGKIQKRAQQVLNEAAYMLEKVAEKGLLQAIEAKMFANVSRSENGGKGLAGVIKKAGDYYNPFIDLFKEDLNL